MNSKNIVEMLLKNKINVLIIILLATICAIVFSSKSFIKPLYKSTVILYPTTTYSVSKAIMNTNGLIYVDPLEIGEEAQTEQMMQILNSGIVRDRIIEKYDLMNHYGIKEDCRYKHDRLIKTYENRIRIRRTEYNSVKIVVLDTDPIISSNIANDMAAMFDETMYNIQKEISQKALAIIEKEYYNTRSDITALEDSLRSTNKSIYRYELDLQKENLRILKTKYDDARINATESIPHKFVITQAYPADKPSYPLRWVIVIVTVIATLIIVTMVLAAFEYYENKHNTKDE